MSTAKAKTNEYFTMNSSSYATQGCCHLQVARDDGSLINDVHESVLTNRTVKLYMKYLMY